MMLIGTLIAIAGFVLVFTTRPAARWEPVGLVGVMLAMYGVWSDLKRQMPPDDHQDSDQSSSSP
jgi:hypothetical protein